MTGNLVRVGPPDLGNGKSAVAAFGRRAAPRATRWLRILPTGQHAADLPATAGWTRRSPGIHSRANRPSPPHGRNGTHEARAGLSDEMSMLSIRCRFHDHRRGAGIRRPMCIAARHRYRKQLSTLSAANLDRPAPPFAVGLDTQIVSDQLRQLERPLGRRKLSHPKMTLRALEGSQGRCSTWSWYTRCQSSEQHRYQGCFDVQLRECLNLKTFVAETELRNRPGVDLGRDPTAFSQRLDNHLPPQHVGQNTRARRPTRPYRNLPQKRPPPGRAGGGGPITEFTVNEA